jgi:co-chaperonin GroES (HSP10)
MDGKSNLLSLRTDVIVDPLYDPERVETGLSPGAPALYMPDSGKNPMSQQGIVVATGNPDVEIGDHVLYHPFIGTPIWEGDHEYLRIEARHLVGYLSPSGELWPLPMDVVVSPIFEQAGRPVLQSSGLWVPKQLYTPDIPSTGIVVRVGTRAGADVKPGQCVLFPPNRGAEVGLRKVFYVIHGRDLLAVLEKEVKATVKLTPAWWQVPDQRHDANNSY